MVTVRPAALQKTCTLSQMGSEGGDQIIKQVILLESLRQAALEAHNSHTTASHRGVRKALFNLVITSEDLL